MTKRAKIVLASGFGLLVAVAITLYLVVREYESPESSSTGHLVWSHENESGAEKASVLYWFDSSYYRVKGAIRIDIIGGVAYSRKEHKQITNVLEYLNEELAKQDATRVVVTASHEEKFGDVVRILAECRKSRAERVVMNEYLDEFLAK